MRKGFKRLDRWVLLVGRGIIWDIRVQNSIRFLDIPSINSQLDAAKRVGIEPIHPYHVVIEQKAFDTGRFERALRQLSIQQAPITADRNQISKSDLIIRYRLSGRHRMLLYQFDAESPSSEFGSQRLTGNVGQFVRLSRNFLQLPVHLSGVELRQTPPLTCWIN